MLNDQLILALPGRLRFCGVACKVAPLPGSTVSDLRGFSMFFFQKCESKTHCHSLYSWWNHPTTWLSVYNWGMSFNHVHQVEIPSSCKSRHATNASMTGVLRAVNRCLPPLRHGPVSLPTGKAAQVCWESARILLTWWDRGNLAEMAGGEGWRMLGWIDQVHGRFGAFCVILCEEIQTLLRCSFWSIL